MEIPDVYELRLKFAQKDGSLRVEYDTIFVNKYTTLSKEIALAKAKYKDSAEGNIEVTAKIKPNVSATYH